MKTEQSELLMQYYQAIMLLQNKEDIINALPNTDYSCFDYIMNGLIELLNKDVEKTTNLLNHEFDPEMKEYMQDEINTLLFKKQECERLIEKANQIKENEELTTTVTNRNIIFATTFSGKIYLKEDLKDIAEEYYQDIYECLNKIENEKDLSSIEKPLTNNAKMSKIRELKPFQVRVCYKMLAPDLVYIIIAKTKKSDNDRIDRERIIERNRKTKKEFEHLTEAIKNPLTKQQLIDENKLIKDDIIDYINAHKRGETK